MGSSRYLALACLVAATSLMASGVHANDEGPLGRMNYHVRIAIERRAKRIAIQPTRAYHIIDPRGEAVYTMKPGAIHVVEVVEGRPGGKLYRLVIRDLDPYQEQSALTLVAAARDAYGLPTKAVRFANGDESKGERILVLVGEFKTLEAAREYKASLKNETIRFIFEEKGPPVDAEVRVRDHRGRIVASHSSLLRLAPLDVAEASLYVENLTGKKDWTPRSVLGGRHYRGNMNLAIDVDGRLTAVNELWIEYYLYGVVAAEIGNFAPEAALKAQAVVARSEAVAKIERGIVSPDGLYHFVDTSLHQTYKGKGQENDAVRKAVDQTRGEILIHDGRAVDAVYSHSCGGVISSAADMWDGIGLDYSTRKADRLGAREVGDLSDWKPAHEWTSRAVTDALCFPGQAGFPSYAKKYFRWVRSFTAEQLSELMNRSGDLGRVKNVVVDKRSQSGRVRGMRAVGERKTKRFDTELSIRGAFGGLRSTFFTFTTERDAQGKLKTLTLHGAGYGHGVGMCQMGAYMLAIKKYSYRQILGHYFSDVKIRRLYG